MGFLQRLAHWAQFGRGWTSRVADIRATALADIALQPPYQSTDGVNDMPFLDGYKTYIVGLLMLAVGVAQALGIEVPAFGDYSGPQMIMEAFAVIFLRRGLKGDLGKV
jgi:lysozyme family protein